jgi:very-short-patch-repair endonuclease
VDGIPVTSPARTLLDLAGTLGGRVVERALARGLREGLVEESEVREMIDRRPRHIGVSVLRSILDREGGPSFTRSEAESRLLGLIRRAKLSQPEVNVPVQGYEVDFLWPAERLIVEVDGFRYHSSSPAFEKDRHRDGVLAAAGYQVVRVTWRQLTNEPEALLARLAQALVRTDRT